MSRDLVGATLECNDRGPDGCLDKSSGKQMREFIERRKCVEQGFAAKKWEHDSRFVFQREERHVERGTSQTTRMRC